MSRYDIVVPSLDCVVVMQIFRKMPKPFEKEYSVLEKKKISSQAGTRKLLRILDRAKHILWNLVERISGFDENYYSPIDYDGIIKTLDANDPLIISGCIDILFDMGIITAEWQDGRRVFRIKSEAFSTIENMYKELKINVAFV